MRNGIITLAAGAMLMGGGAAATDAAILLNFGATVVNNNNSPAHKVGGVTGTSWNLVTADAGSGIVDDQGVATGVSVNLGKESGTATKVLDWAATGYSNNALGTAQNTGIYAGNGKSATFVNNGANSNIAIGVRIGGLAAGTYDLYMSARNTNSHFAETFNVWFTSVASGAGNTDYNALTPQTLATPATVFAFEGGPPLDMPSTWVSGVSYLKQTFTIAAGQDLIVIDEGFGTNSSYRGFINTVGIVAVPEPGSLGLLGLGGLALLRRRRQA